MFKIYWDGKFTYNHAIKKNRLSFSSKSVECRIDLAHPYITMCIKMKFTKTHYDYKVIIKLLTFYLGLSNINHNRCSDITVLNIS